ncbi:MULTISPECIES: type II secretion system F family protein [Burkholderiaceae]|uniref:type II secretion system F family protein n=1 Tax=Burkholderiaceae TaxID=119060 RepID=UPI0014239B66|nr:MULTISPECIES: type II secretion system F family protein [Burkholderiaceae]MBN3847654.1 type II secretion system F family protein [Paraburkholderia sp. Ac-20342]NIF53397.1 type II secretion system F family protein [Burkholderia sp. Ax-1724]NIF78682.1 type II secretion system F family protein [Paraburkholderia sp. Cy-641]
MNPIFYAAIILLFVAVVLATSGVYEYWDSRHGPTARRVAARIRAVSAGGQVSRERLSILKTRMLAESAWLTRFLLLIPRVHALDLFLQQSGLQWSVGRLVGTCAVLPLFVLMIGASVALPWFVSVAIAVFAALLPIVYVQRRRNRRIRQLERQLPDVCDMLARALRSGHAFTGAIDMVGTEFAEPMSGEFRIVFDEINYGVSISEALTNLATRVPIRDLRYFVIAVVIQRETGGNLAEVLDGITALIRDRFKLFDKVRVLSAEGKMSAWVLGLMPFGVGAAMMVLNPDFLDILWRDSTGVKMVVSSGVGMLFGIFWMRHIVKIRV